MNDKKIIISILIFCLVFAVFSGCNYQLEAETETSVTSVVTSVYETSTTQSIMKTETQIDHSPLYIEGYNVRRISMYFEETALHREYSNGSGNKNCVQKWVKPITYCLNGDFTESDAGIINEFFDFCSGIEKFPRVTKVQNESEANFNIYFLPRDDFNEKIEEYLGVSTADGGENYWYDKKTNEITKAIVCILSTLNSDERKSVILEELYNSMGFSNDTSMRKNSIIYQNSNDNTELSEVDILLMNILYSDEIKLGMKYQECKNVIEKIYY